MSKTYVIYGVSKGLGQAILHAVPQTQDLVYGISRSQPQCDLAHFKWIPADLSKPEHARDVVKNQVVFQKVC